MSVILHFADLHLSTAEENYSFTVLEELFSEAVLNKADAVLITGDLFDSYDDMLSLRPRFRKALAGLSVPEVFFIPGNHEELRGQGRNISALDLGNITLLSIKPFELAVRQDYEILAVPHSASYADFTQWQVPPRGSRLRILAAHASVAGFVPYFDESEENQSYLDGAIPSRLDCQFAALGHIHKKATLEIEGVPCSYPGSARVWRKGETGRRGYNLLRITDNVTAEWRPISSAGEYRELTLPLTLEGGFTDLDYTGIGPWDYITVNAAGFIEDDTALPSLCGILTEQGLRNCRRFEVNRDQVLTAGGISAMPLVRHFLGAWEKAEPPSSAGPSARQAWLRAREIGVREILNAGGKR